MPHSRQLKAASVSVCFQKVFVRLYRCLTACQAQEGSVRTKQRACLLQDAECRGEHALLLILISALLQQRLHIQLETFCARRKKYVPLHLSHGTPVVTFTVPATPIDLPSRHKFGEQVAPAAAASSFRLAGLGALSVIRVTETLHMGPCSTIFYPYTSS